MRIVILGGGILGQLAKLVFPEAVIFEKRPRLDSGFTPKRQIITNYSWEEIPVLEQTPFPVRVTVDEAMATEESVRRYKKKVGKESDMEGDWGIQFHYRMVAFEHKRPELPVQWGHEASCIDWEDRRVHFDKNIRPYKPFSALYDVLISTIPMPELIKIVGGMPKEGGSFHSRPVFAHLMNTRWGPEGSVEINYHSDPDDPCFRETRFGEQSLFESFEESPYDTVSTFGHGVCTNHGGNERIKYGKIWKGHFEECCYRDLLEKRIFCVGREASWNPDELLHGSFHKLLNLKNQVLGMEFSDATK